MSLRTDDSDRMKPGTEGPCPGGRGRLCPSSRRCGPAVRLAPEDWPAEPQTQEIAQDLVSRLDAGLVLDVGIGPGMLLLELHR